MSGTTYSAFNDQETLKGKAEACEIFPGVVENQFEELIAEVDDFAASLAPFFHYNSPSISFPDEKNKGKSLQSMKERSDDLASRIHTYETKLKRLQDQKQKYSDSEKEVLDHLQSITRLMQEIRASASFHPHCLDIDKGGLPEQLTQKLEQIEYLSEGTKKKVRDLFSLFPDSRGAVVSRAVDKNFTKEVEKGMSAVTDDLTRSSSKVSSKLKTWQKQKQNLDTAIKKKQEEKRAAEKAKKEAEEEKRKEQKAEEEKNKEKKTKEQGSKDEKPKETPSPPAGSKKKEPKDAVKETKPQKKEKTEQKPEQKKEKSQEQPSKTPEKGKKEQQPPEETEEKADEKQTNPEDS